jgi:hypothetical protein
MLRMEPESVTTLASTGGEAEGFARRIALLKGKLVDGHQARDTAYANSRGLSSMVTDADQ